MNKEEKENLMFMHCKYCIEKGQKDKVSVAKLPYENTVFILCDTCGNKITTLKVQL